MKLKTRARVRRQKLFEIAVFLILFVAFSEKLSCHVVTAQGRPGVPEQGFASRGEEEFVGKVAFHNGGPPCVSCHSIAGVPFPNGGTLGPDLTQAYAKLGPQGMQPAMQTLFFNVMTPIYDQHPLTPQEQSDLIAFFREGVSGREPRWNTQIIAGVSFIVFVILLVITSFLWQDRLISVRRTLVEKALQERLS